MVCIRLTEDDYARRVQQARELGLTVSGLCERLVLDGKVDASAQPAYRAMDPALFAELRRVGNNANQIAHALNSNLPPDVVYAWRTAHDLLNLLARQELLGQRASAERTQRTDRASNDAFVQKLAQALAPKNSANDPPAPQARDVFQRSVRVHPARPEGDVP